MGLPMTLNLAKQWNVIAFDTNEHALKICSDNGVQIADSVEQVGASDCSVIFTSLPGCSAVDAVTPLLLEGASYSESPIVFVDCSTVSEHYQFLNFL